MVQLSGAGRYYDELAKWAAEMDIQLLHVPADCGQAYHMFYMLMPLQEARTEFMQSMIGRGVSTVFHYLPLHDSPMGKQYNLSHAKWPVTCGISCRMLRLPFFNDLTLEEQRLVVNTAKTYRSRS